METIEQRIAVLRMHVCCYTDEEFDDLMAAIRDEARAKEQD